MCLMHIWNIALEEQQKWMRKSSSLKAALFTLASLWFIFYIKTLIKGIRQQLFSFLSPYKWYLSSSRHEDLLEEENFKPSGHMMTTAGDIKISCNQWVVCKLIFDLTCSVYSVRSTCPSTRRTNGSSFCFMSTNCRFPHQLLVSLCTHTWKYH